MIIAYVQRMPSRISFLCHPAVPEASVVLDLVEIGIDITKLLADTLDKGAYIGAISLGAVAREEILTVDAIVDLPVADVFPRALG